MTERSVTVTIDVENRTGRAPDTVILVRAQRGHDPEPILIASQDELISDDALRGAMATLLRSALRLVEGNDEEWVDGGKYAKGRDDAIRELRRVGLTSLVQYTTTCLVCGASWPDGPDTESHNDGCILQATSEVTET